MRGFVMGCYPNGTLDVSPDDDAVFARLAERGIPLSIHVSLTQAHAVGPPLAAARVRTLLRRAEPDRAADLRRACSTASPRLDVVVAEVDCGWVPYFKEQIDNNYQRLDAVSDFTIQRAAERLRRAQRALRRSSPTRSGSAAATTSASTRMLWSSDYPHISADWPYSWRTIQAAMSGVPHDERELILAGNAVRLYNF